MSLDITLRMKGAAVVRQSPGIFVRQNGQNVEISEEEWYKRHPGREPVKFNPGPGLTDEVYSANITHNLGAMAAAAGVYRELWRPDEAGITTARHLIKPLTDGLLKLKSDPGKFQPLNPANGWGTYEGLVAFVDKLLEACKQYPDALIEASR